ncbi:hypothetical protein [Moorella sp. Hama-1]|uniref:hypothetical protein n=1 Tax=Moorella sp. Hama-1 TaxID=2138101 RepID=UPI000D6497B3|nr:hypothetical protein [Moorella sp. Hama-1]BCV20210.1 hypothetical protein hamaS1_02790 [Moorella sp. Hama-1]
MRRFLILPAIFLALLALAPPAQSTAITDSLRQQLKNNANEESRLFQEIMLLDARLQKTRDEGQKLARGLVTAREQLQAARSRQEQAEARLAAGRQDLGRSLRFFQTYGASPYILAAVFSRDLPDFFIRWELLKYLGNHFLGIVRNNLALYRLAREEEAQVAAREKELQQAQAALQAAEERLAALKKEREIELDNLRRQSTSWSRDLLALEEAWSGALPTLHYLLGQLPVLPWKDLKPDAVNVDFARGEVLATFSQQNLNATLLAPAKLPGVHLALSDGGLLIPGPDFQITGNLQVAGPHQLLFIPQGVTFAGLPLSPATWSELLPREKLTIDLPPPDFGLEFKDINLAPGRMVLVLKK